MGIGFILLMATAFAVDTDGDGWEDDIVAPDASVPLSVSIGAGSVVQSGAVVGEHTVIGADCVIGTRSRLGTGVTLGDQVIVARTAQLEDFVVVGNEVVIDRSSVVGAFTQIGDTVGLGFGIHVGASSQIGEFVVVGANAQLGSEVSVHPGSVLARGVNVGAATTIGTAQAGAIIGPDVQFGEHSQVGSRVRIRKDVVMGIASTVGDDGRIGRDSIVGQRATIADGARFAARTIVQSCADVPEDTTTIQGAVVTGSCAGATLVDIGAGRHGWSDGYLPATCAEYRAPFDTEARTYSGFSGSGVYRLMTASGPIDAYCDMLTDGGGWTLLAKFAQPAGGMGGLSQTTYDTLVADAGWILGDATLPTSPTSSYLDFDIESHAWSDILGPPGTPFTLRQRFFRNAGSSPSDLPVDYKWDTVYTGHVVQDTVPASLIEVLGTWPLAGRTVLQDASSIVWDVPSPDEARFWLPFTSALPDTRAKYAACNGASLDEAACGAYTTPNFRRFGSAGIIGSAPDNNDPAGAWAPFFDAESASGNANIVYVHQAQAIYGTSAQPTTLQYWAR